MSPGVEDSGQPKMREHDKGFLRDESGKKGKLAYNHSFVCDNQLDVFNPTLFLGFELHYTNYTQDGFDLLRLKMRKQFVLITSFSEVMLISKQTVKT
jgi:hypothetical protein